MGSNNPYYRANRKKILAKMKERYETDEEYREATRERARRRYHEDKEYREATIRRAKERYRRLKRRLKKGSSRS